MLIFLSSEPADMRNTVYVEVKSSPFLVTKLDYSELPTTMQISAKHRKRKT